MTRRTALGGRLEALEMAAAARDAELTERQVDAMVGAVEAALDAAGITGQRAVDALRAAAGYLRAVSTEGRKR